MNTIRRLSATISAQINGIIDQLENHEAVANIALNDVRESMMNAKFQVRRIQDEQRVFEHKLQALRKEESIWKERALRCEKDDRERALECVRRLTKAREEISALSQQLSDHRELERQMSVDVKKIETKFEELKRKKSLLTARESRASAMQTLNAQKNSIDPGGVFDRWEQQILRSEVEGDLSESLSAERADAFTTEFSNEEERRALEETLESLLRDSGKHDSQ